MYTRKQRAKIYLKAAKLESEKNKGYWLAFADFNLRYRKAQSKGLAPKRYRDAFPEMQMVDYNGCKHILTSEEVREIRIIALLLCYEMAK